MTYRAPIKDMLFTLDTICDISSLKNLVAFSETTRDMVMAISTKLLKGPILKD